MKSSLRLVCVFIVTPSDGFVVSIKLTSVIVEVDRKNSEAVYDAGVKNLLLRVMVNEQGYWYM